MILLYYICNNNIWKYTLNSWYNFLKKLTVFWTERGKTTLQSQSIKSSFMTKGFVFFPHWTFYFRSLKLSDHFLSLCLDLVTETLHPRLWCETWQRGACCKFILFYSPSVLGLSAQNDEFVFDCRSSGLWGMESAGLGVASAPGLALHRSRAGSVNHHQQMPPKSSCRDPFVLP